MSYSQDTRTCRTADTDAALELIYTEYVARCEQGQKPDREDWYRHYPERRDRLERLFGFYDLISAHDTLGSPLET